MSEEKYISNLIWIKIFAQASLVARITCHVTQKWSNSPVPGDRCMYLTTIVYEQLLTSARDGQVRKSRKQARHVSKRQGNFARIRVFFFPVLYSF